MAVSRPFAQVDVFSATPFYGNPVAVVLEADGLCQDQMQRIARWTNLSETTFVFSPSDPSADYQLRIFTPTRELPFAGHPTLGSARAWLEAGGIPKQPGRLVQQCAAGLVTLRTDGQSLAFKAPPLVRSGALDAQFLDEACRALHLAPEQILAHQWVDNGPGWAVVELADAHSVLQLEPDLSQMPTRKLGVIGAYPAGSAKAFEIRAFAPGGGVAEDPVTGSLNAGVASWMLPRTQLGSRYSVGQGSRLGRNGLVQISREADGLWVGGETSICFQGSAFAG